MYLQVLFRLHWSLWSRYQYMCASYMHWGSSSNPGRDLWRKEDGGEPWSGFLHIIVDLNWKGLSYETYIENVDENWQILALKRAPAGFRFFWKHLWFLVEINIFFPVNAKITLTAYVIRLSLQQDSRQAFRTNAMMFYTVLRARIIFLKYVHPAKRARAQKLYIVSSYTYAFDETFTCVWMILRCISLEWHEAHFDDGYTQTNPPASSLIFKWSRCSSSLLLIGRQAGPWLGDTRRRDRRIGSDSIYKLRCTYVYTLNMTI